MTESNPTTELLSNAIKYLRIEGIIISNFVSNGSFSNVFKANSENNVFAVKAIALKDKNRNRNSKNSMNIENEKRISLFVSHQNIIKNYKILEFSDNFVFFVNDFADGGDLITLIEKDKDLGEVTVRNWFAQVVDAVDYLHGNGIAHRDIKPDNVLLCHGLAKLTDFSLAQFALNNSKEVLMTNQFRGTHEYSSPENLNCILFDKPFDPFLSDCYSLGILLFILITLNFPFVYGKTIRTNDGVKRLYRKQMDQKWKLTKKYGKNRLLYSLLKQLLNPDVSARVRASQISTHLWFQT